jgi:hypothetical protein
VRAIILTISFIFFTFPAFQDYTRFFPSDLYMEVFFDDAGINESLKDFSKKELDSLKIREDWKEGKKKYFKKINDHIYRLFGISDFFNVDGIYIYSSGETTFFVEKIKGWQKYFIKDAKGFLEHSLELPYKEKIKLKSSFILLNTHDNYIYVSLNEIYLKYTKIIKPQFKQIIHFTVIDDKALYHHTLSAVTKLTLFPIINISHTIYLIGDDSSDKMIPIGYAIYRPR